MNDIEIPAFMRKQSSLESVASHDAMYELSQTLQTLTSNNSPVRVFVTDFNTLSLSYTQFTSTLTACLQTNQTSYLDWLVTKHMKTDESAAAVWAVFIHWVAETFAIHLDRHAQRLLRDFLKTVKPTIQDAVRVDLETLKQDQMLSNESAQENSQ